MDDVIKEELMDVFEAWCSESINPKEVSLDFQRSEDIGSYKSLVTEVFWTSWLGGYGCGFGQGLTLCRQ